jgi:hypothetical protein
MNQTESISCTKVVTPASHAVSDSEQYATKKMISEEKNRCRGTIMVEATIPVPEDALFMRNPCVLQGHAVSYR